MDVKDMVQALIQGPVPYALQDRQTREQLEVFLAARLARSPFPHRQLLLCAGQLPEYLYYVEKGLIRGYFYDDATGRTVTCFYGMKTPGPCHCRDSFTGSPRIFTWR